MILNLRDCQQNYGTNNDTNTEEEIRFKNRIGIIKLLKQKDSKILLKQVTRIAVKTLTELSSVSSKENRMSSEAVQFHAGAFSNCSVTFNVNYTEQLSFNFPSVRNQFSF